MIMPHCFFHDQQIDAQEHNRILIIFKVSSIVIEYIDYRYHVGEYPSRKA